MEPHLYPQHGRRCRPSLPSRWAARALLGEGPSGTLAGRRVVGGHQGPAAACDRPRRTDRVIDWRDQPGCVVVRASGGLVCATPDGFVAVDPEDGRQTLDRSRGGGRPRDAHERRQGGSGRTTLGGHDVRPGRARWWRALSAGRRPAGHDHGQAGGRRQRARLDRRWPGDAVHRHPHHARGPLRVRPRDRRPWGAPAMGDHPGRAQVRRTA